jgi:hypothetical protein
MNDTKVVRYAVDYAADDGTITESLAAYRRLESALETIQ